MPRETKPRRAEKKRSVFRDNRAPKASKAKAANRSPKTNPSPIQIKAKALAEQMRGHFGDLPPVTDDDVRFICHYNGVRHLLDFFTAYAWLWLADIGWVLPINFYRCGVARSQVDPYLKIKGNRYEFMKALHLASRQGLSIDSFVDILGVEFLSRNSYAQLSQYVRNKVGPIVDECSPRIKSESTPLTYRIVLHLTYFVVVDVERNDVDVDWHAFTIPPVSD